MNKKTKSGVILMAIGLLLIAVALCFIGRNLYLDKRAGGAARDALTELEKRVSASVPTEPGGEETPTAPTEDIEPTSPSEPAEEPTVSDKIEEIGGAYFIGRINLPTIERELPVATPFDLDTLYFYPCLYDKNERGNMVIGGHNFINHFKYIDKMKKGDPVLFTDNEGNTFSYKVYLTEEISGDAGELLTLGDYPLTLFTCDFSGRSRVVVRCVRE